MTATKRAEKMAMLRRNFLATPGATEADFDRVKDELFLDHAKMQALNGAADRQIRSLDNSRDF